MKTETLEAQVCVVGGGMAGLCAALAAARHGASVVLMHERPVLGGNASSECRVHVCGADRHGALPYLRETGILEELRLENLSRNPHRSYSIWDLVLYEAARLQPNLTLLLNCTCLEAEMAGSRIAQVTGWQLTTQTYQQVRAQIYADCSGDAILAPLTGAHFRVGREARSEYGEPAAPETADQLTMGMSLLFHAREYDAPQPFVSPAWAYDFPADSDLPYGEGGHRWWETGYWWVELGGEQDSIHDTERIRDELLRISLGVWDHIKNHGDHGADHWSLEWLQFLPGKRESRRYVGDHLLTQLDIEAEGKFADVVAYGGWEMDDHHPAGFWSARLGCPSTTFYPTPSPYGIPYRSLYSANIENLMFAGRCASCTHMAMSSARVAGTGASMGQAVGTAAALATSLGVPPRELGSHLPGLQQALLADDCYLPGLVQEMPPLTAQARLVASQGDPEPLRDGVNRPVGEVRHGWLAHPGDSCSYLFPRPARVEQATLVLDSALEAIISLSHHRRKNQFTTVPPVMPKAFRLEGQEGEAWVPLAAVTDNHQRLVRLPVRRQLSGLRWVLESTWGSNDTWVYACYLD